MLATEGIEYIHNIWHTLNILVFIDSTDTNANWNIKKQKKQNKAKKPHNKILMKMGKKIIIKLQWSIKLKTVAFRR